MKEKIKGYKKVNILTLELKNEGIKPRHQREVLFILLDFISAGIGAIGLQITDSGIDLEFEYPIERDQNQGDLVYSQRRIDHREDVERDKRLLDCI